MKNSYLLHFSPEVEQIIHPVSYQIKKTGKYIVAVILTLSQQYSDQDNLKFSQLQSNKRWHTINEIYEPAFGKCLSGDQLQGIERPNIRTLQVINCKSGKVLVEGILQ